MITLACAAFVTGMFTIGVGCLLFTDDCKKDLSCPRATPRRPFAALVIMLVGLLMLAPAMEWVDDAHAASRRREQAREQAMVEFIIKTAMRDAIEFEAKRRELGYK